MTARLRDDDRRPRQDPRPDRLRALRGTPENSRTQGRSNVTVSRPSLRVRTAVVLGGAAVLLAACAQMVLQEPTQLTPSAGKSFRLTRAAEVTLSTGYSTTLRADTRWQLVGTVTQGEVYRTKDQVVTLEGAHIHEGYIVVNQGPLVGFYLPVERTFSPVVPVRPLSIEP